jgi:hypothetical protein
MRRTKRNRWLHAAALVLPVLWLSGCIEYTIETAMNADGSGTRHEEMVVDEGEGEDIGVTYSEFGELMFVAEGRGWTHREEVRKGDSVHVFRRETAVGSIDSWSENSDRVRIAGAVGADAESSIGHVRLGDVQFRNAVEAETGRAGEYTTYSYRERFYWENFPDVLVEYFAQSFAEVVETRYPDLTSEQRGEVLGLVKGGLWSAIDQGLLDANDEEEEELVSAFAERTASQAARIVRQTYSDADAGSLEALLVEHYDDDEDELGDFIEDRLPGVQLALQSEIVFRLSMPGRVTTSNAHDRDGSTLIWKFGPTDAATAPVVIFAESVIGR